MCISTPTLCVDRTSIHFTCKQMVKDCYGVSCSHIEHQKWFLIAHAWPVNFQFVSFVIISHLDSCSCCGGIPGSSSRHSLSPAYFMGTGGRTSQMVFLRNYYVLIHSEGACCSLPLFPSYWEVTVRLTKGRECDGWCERWWYLRFLALNVGRLGFILPWSLEDKGEGAEQAGELRNWTFIQNWRGLLPIWS